MVEPAVSIPRIHPDLSVKKGTSDNPIDQIRNRRSQELVIGLCGAIGSGIKSLKNTLITQLTAHGYHVETIRLSELISEKFPSELILTGYDRYEQLQNLGDQLRSEYSNDIVAALAVTRITILREALFGDEKTNTNIVKVTKKVAYIIDQLKHPDEIELLKEVYRNNFYLIGLLRTEAERKANLKDEGITEPDTTSLIERDRKATEKNGQQVEDSLYKSDYFIRNIDVAEKIGKSVERFIKLVHGTDIITPTNDEIGMYAAQSAALRSACLSRQVGAAITDEYGIVLSTGCNDVPKFGGGLYNSESEADKRCFNYGNKECHNDKHKKLLKNEIEKILNKNGVDNAQKISEEILKQSKAKSLIEYSRAIHAEMDAITALARSTTNSTQGKTLYCTTYPCHLCARHIVAAGILRVVYIEPYEKSLALQLHGDTICHPDNITNVEKVLFENFEGVSPQRYAKFFSYNQKRKDLSGNLIPHTVMESGHVDPQYLDSYGDYELAVVRSIKQKFPE